VNCDVNNCLQINLGFLGDLKYLSHFCLVAYQAWFVRLTKFGPKFLLTLFFLSSILGTGVRVGVTSLSQV